MNPGKDGVVIHEELKIAISLLKKFFDLEIDQPRLYIGNQYRSLFFKPEGSMGDLVFSSMLRGAYSGKLNGIFVPDEMMKTGHARRVLTLAHECVHAFSVSQNPALREENILQLTQSNFQRDAEKGYVYSAFDEGLATYLSIRCGLESGIETIVIEAGCDRLDIADSLREWTSPENLKLMAIIYGERPRNWRKILVKRFEGTPGALWYCQYQIGYNFIQFLKPNAKTIKRIISFPPSKVSHLLYPRTYLKSLKQALTKQTAA